MIDLNIDYDEGKYEIERQYIELFFGLVFDSQLFIKCWIVLWSQLFIKRIAVPLSKYNVLL